MPGFVPISLTISLAVALSPGKLAQLYPSIGDSQYGKLIYEVRSVNDARGLGGRPGFCVGPTSDLVMVLYTVRNENNFEVAGPAVPRMVLLDQFDNELRPDRRYTDALQQKLMPYLALPHGKIQPRQVVLLADVFVTPKQAVNIRPWKFRVEPKITRVVRLPQSKRAESPEC